MQPAKALAASKNAALPSVTSTPVRSSAAGTCPSRAAAWHSASSATARSRPHRPVPEQAADDAALDRAGWRLQAERRHEIADDGVVVAGVERDVVAAGVDDRADDVERLIAVERRDLDRHDAPISAKRRQKA